MVGSQKIKSKVDRDKIFLQSKGTSTRAARERYHAKQVPELEDLRQRASV